LSGDTTPSKRIPTETRRSQFMSKHLDELAGDIFANLSHVVIYPYIIVVFKESFNGVFRYAGLPVPTPGGLIMDFLRRADAPKAYGTPDPDSQSIHLRSTGHESFPSRTQPLRTVPVAVRALATSRRFTTARRL
jgi:hypothetical protein